MNEKKSWIVAQVKKMASSGDEVAGKVIPINQETKAGQKILNFLSRLFLDGCHIMSYIPSCIAHRS